METLTLLVAGFLFNDESGRFQAGHQHASQRPDSRGITRWS